MGVVLPFKRKGTIPAWSCWKKIIPAKITYFGDI
jgi:hypothetical protein